MAKPYEQPKVMITPIALGVFGQYDTPVVPDIRPINDTELLPLPLPGRKL